MLLEKKMKSKRVDREFKELIEAAATIAVNLRSNGYHLRSGPRNADTGAPVDGESDFSRLERAIIAARRKTSKRFRQMEARRKTLRHPAAYRGRLPGSLN